MVSCNNILNLKCMFVNELIGSPELAILILAIFYFIVAAKLRLGFDTTIFLAVPLIIAAALAIVGMQTIYIFLVFIGGVLLALIILRVMGNR